MTQVLALIAALIALHAGVVAGGPSAHPGPTPMDIISPHG
jgi:hypothetical protein